LKSNSRTVAAVVVVVAWNASPVLAGWSASPVTVTATTASIPLVEGCSDGAYGAFVAWQEESTPGVGALRAQHLLPTGELDPAWLAAGAGAASVLAARSELVALPDRLGGVYLLWKEGETLYATRLEASGAVAAGWPSRGRSLGTLYAYSPRPGAIEDGAHGFYAAWITSSREAMAIHIGPANTGAGGWPNEASSISYNDPFAIWAQLALAPDGGLFVAWASYGDDGYGAVTPGVWRLQRLTTAGETAVGWPGGGRDLGVFHYEYISDSREPTSLLALSEDGRGGVFLMKGDPTTPAGYNSTLETRLYRLQANGQSAVDWPAGGVIVPHAATQYQAAGDDPDASHRLLSDHRDGVLVGAFKAATDNGSRIEFRQCSAAAQFQAALSAWGPPGYEIAGRDDGGFYVAFFGCCFDVYQSAYIQVAQFPAAAGLYEQHFESFGQWYGDIGLARTDDGGAVFFWSQQQGSVGLFARRFNAAGEVTAVGPGSSDAPALSRLRFVPGVGVRASIGGPVPDRARIELFDLAGRRLASQAIAPEVHAAREAAGQEVTIAGTAALPSGLYFGRLVAGARMAAAKLMVAR